ncbi:MAG: hypothetical protein KDB63_07415 [Nocardioidaceae bacterium]|nr:hypothetical protein [Nocardioidaceae bacterium]
MTNEPNYVEQKAAQWAATDPLERWVDAAPDGPSSIEETVGEYLGSHNPFPDGTRVDVLGRDGQGWTPATVIQRTAADEWTIEFDDGEQAWRDHHELRPAADPTV